MFIKELKCDDVAPKRIDLITDNIDLNKSLDWELVSTATIVKKEFKYFTAKFEIIQSYFHAAEVLSQNMGHPINSGTPVIKLITLRSLCIPFLYLCRQTAELSIKFAIEITKTKISKNPTHNIKNLWKKFVDSNSSMILDQEKIFIDRIGAFVDFLSSIDCDGSHLRYATSNQDELYREKPYLINPKNIMTELSSMITTINSIDADLFLSK